MIITDMVEFITGLNAAKESGETIEVPKDTWYYLMHCAKTASLAAQAVEDADEGRKTPREALETLGLPKIKKGPKKRRDLEEVEQRYRELTGQAGKGASVQQPPLGLREAVAKVAKEFPFHSDRAAWDALDRARRADRRENEEYKGTILEGIFDDLWFKLPAKP